MGYPSVRERAADILHFRHSHDGEKYSADSVAEHLDLADLLTPDLPEPSAADGPKGTQEWAPNGRDGWVAWSAPKGRVMIQHLEPGDLTPNEARELAYSILAAADHAEGKDNE